MKNLLVKIIRGLWTWWMHVLDLLTCLLGGHVYEFDECDSNARKMVYKCQECGKTRVIIYRPSTEEENGPIK